MAPRTTLLLLAGSFCLVGALGLSRARSHEPALVATRTMQKLTPAPLAADGGAQALPASALVPARVRRLSNAEYDATVHALLGTSLRPGSNFAPDARQAGFTENEAQRIDPVLAKQVAAAADKLAREARGHFDVIAPCASMRAPEACAENFIRNFGARAYRRPLAPAERDELLDVYREGTQAGGYEDGIQLVISALLQAPSFLYLTELGVSDAAQHGGSVQLSDYELASELSYLMTGGPPDQKLLEAAAAGVLQLPAFRRSELRRLRADHPESRDHLVRLVREWLQLDVIENTAKDPGVYPTYELYWRPLIDESHQFIAAVLDERERNTPRTSDLSTLLAADWTVGGKLLQELYGAEALPAGKLKLAARRGILNQGAFLSVQAHARTSAPVLRGAVIARRLACIPVLPPGTAGVIALPPPPDPQLTTRERFEIHATNPTCADCHDKLDDLGFTFEQYDGMGALRDNENGKPIDSQAQITMGTDFDGSYPNSNALAEALATSTTVLECFARHMFRAGSARSVDSGGAQTAVAEDAFIAHWRRLPDAARGNLMDILSAYVESPLFAERRAL